MLLWIMVLLFFVYFVIMHELPWIPSVTPEGPKPWIRYDTFFCVLFGEKKNLKPQVAKIPLNELLYGLKKGDHAWQAPPSSRLLVGTGWEWVLTQSSGTPCRTWRESNTIHIPRLLTILASSHSKTIYTIIHKYRES